MSATTTDTDLATLRTQRDAVAGVLWLIWSDAQVHVRTDPDDVLIWMQQAGLAEMGPGGVRLSAAGRAALDWRGRQP